MEPSRLLEQDPSSAPSSLLEQAKQHDDQAWRRLVDLYGPAVYRWARLSGLQSHDALDIIQEVFASVSAALDGFRRDRPGDSFRAWLRTITQNKIRDLARHRKLRVEAAGGSEAHARLAAIIDSGSADWLDEGDDAEAALLHRALELVRAEFEPRTWQAFWQTTVEGKLPSDVADSLGIAVASVYQAKSRVLRRLRAEFDGLFDG